MAEHRTTLPYINQLIQNLTMIPVKNIIAISSIVMIPVLYLCYHSFYPSSVAMIENDKAHIKVTIPKIKSPSF